MPIEIKMPALSPTMEEGTLAKWLVKEGDTVKSGDILAEIETDKATMEFETIDEGTVQKLLVAEGTDGVKVGAPILVLAGEGEDASTPAPKADTAPAKPAAAPQKEPEVAAKEPSAAEKGQGGSPAAASAPSQADKGGSVGAGDGKRVSASPLARRIAEQKGIDITAIAGSGPNGRVIKTDVESAQPGAAKPAVAAAPASQPAAAATPAHAVAPAPEGVPSETIKLSNMRKTIARRLSESKQQVPHIYLTVDINLDALLKLRTELNKGLESRGVKLSVNDMLIKAQAAALMEVPSCNVQFAGDSLIQFKRADISVAVSIPGGLITPVVTSADTKSLSAIATEIKDLAGRAREGKLQPHEYTGGTASLSNMGMFGIKQFEAIINPPQAMILAIGAGEKRPYVVNDSLQIATVMSATGSFDHRAIDGSDGAAFMAAFKRLCENPLGMLA
jgi:pyruvate dehydrogenase E2 component (dihydrolipoamide acetyltransferase)